MERVEYSVMLHVERSGNSLAGVLDLSGEDPLSIRGSVVAGVFSFRVPNIHPGEPDCAAWDVTAEARLRGDNNLMDVVATGIFCGDAGDQGRFTATLRKTVVMVPANYMLLKK
ncbi:MAG: hypothetical protein Kow0089_12130 [Desulfobulbaceae bacterium]